MRLAPVNGICDRCSQKYPLDELKEEYVLDRGTGRKVCWSCYDESHPQLDTRYVRTDDLQSVRDPRSDDAEQVQSRRLFSFYPSVGNQATSTVGVQLGRVTVVTD